MRRRFSDSEIVKLRIEEIVLGPFQLRQAADHEAVKELAANISEQGVLHPILVRPRGTGYELIAGQRRLLASKLAGRSSIPARVLEVDDVEAVSIALVENLARENLSAFEEAIGLSRLQHAVEEAGGSATIAALAKRAGRSVGSVSESLQIARALTEEVIRAARLEQSDLRALPKTALLGAAKATSREERATLLRIAVGAEAPGIAVLSMGGNRGKPQDRRVRGRPLKSYTLAVTAMGRVSLRTRKAPNQFSSREAKELLARLEPFLRQLRGRV